MVQLLFAVSFPFSLFVIWLGLLADHSLLSIGGNGRGTGGSSSSLWKACSCSEPLIRTVDKHRATPSMDYKFTKKGFNLLLTQDYRCGNTTGTPCRVYLIYLLGNSGSKIEP